MLSSVSVSAIEVEKSLKDPLYKDWGTCLLIDGMKEYMEVKNLKNSNPKVCDVYWDKYYDEEKTSPCYDEIQIEPIGVGTTIISGDIYGEGMLLKHFSSKVTFYKYKNPFKKFKIGKKSFVKKFKKRSYLYASNKKNMKRKISIKVKKGYKLEELSIYSNGKTKTIKNNSKIKIKKRKELVINIDVYNKKKKHTEEYSIDYNSEWD